MCEHDRDIRVAPERQLPDKALVEDAAERVDVRPTVDRHPDDLLGRDVVDRAEQVPVVAHVRHVGEPLRQAKVREVDVVGAVGPGAGVEEDVRRLHVAMDETARVGSVERARDLGEDGDCVRRVEPAAAGDARAGRAARRTASR